MMYMMHDGSTNSIKISLLSAVDRVTVLAKSVGIRFANINICRDMSGHYCGSKKAGTTNGEADFIIGELA